MRTLNETRIGEIADRFYEAALDPDLWKPALEETARIVGAEGAAIIGYPAGTAGVVCTTSLNALFEAYIDEEWDRINPRFEYALRRGMDLSRVVTEAQTFTAEELDRHPYNAEFVNKFKFRWFIGAHLGQVARNSTLFSLERRARDEPFSRSDAATINRILPHMQRATRMAIRLNLERAKGMLDGFEQLACAGILLNVAGDVLHMNEQARHHLGSGIMIVHQLLVASHRPANPSLQNLIASVVRPGPVHEAPAAGPVLLPRRQGRPLIAHACPIVGAARDIFHEAKAILILVDPDEHRSIPEEVLRLAFGLTPAEARLAIGLASGRRLVGVAADLGISYEHARSRLKIVQSKAGVQRQSELVLLINRLAAIGTIGAARP